MSTLVLPVQVSLCREQSHLGSDHAFKKACMFAARSPCLAVVRSTSLLGSKRTAAVTVESFELAEEPEEGPVELPNEDLQLDIQAEMSPIRITASIALTGAIAFFLFRSLRRRAKFARETKFRSSGAQKVTSQQTREALNMPPVQSPEAIRQDPPSVIQTLLGAVISGSIALVLYKFTTFVEAGFAGKPVPTEYTVRQITITVRTIINGLCYLATCVFAANCLGLTLFSLQLALNLVPTEAISNAAKDKENDDEPDSINRTLVDKSNEE